MICKVSIAGMFQMNLKIESLQDSLNEPTALPKCVYTYIHVFTNLSIYIYRNTNTYLYTYSDTYT